MVVSLSPKPHFSRLLENWVWSTASSIFVQVVHSSQLFFSNLALDAIEDCIAHKLSTRSMTSWATLAAVYRLFYLSEITAYLNIFEFTIQLKWHYGDLELKQYRQFTRLFSRWAKSSLGTRLGHTICYCTCRNT